MHEIQKFIIVQLMGSESARYSQLKPPTMEGSKFTYHLKQLIENDLVRYSEKSKRYTLSSDGRMLADRFDTILLEEALQPAIIVLAAVERRQNEWLIAKRHIHPAFNMSGFPHVHVQLGSDLIKQAEQNLQTSVSIISRLEYRGHAYVTQYKDNEPESMVLVHFLRGSYVSGDITNLTDEYTYKWSQDPDWKSSTIIPSSGDLIQLSQKKSMFFAELTYHL